MQHKTAAVAAAMLTVSFGSITHAMPQGEVVRSGAATIQRSDDHKNMEIDQGTKRAAIDWSSFDIANDERVNFRQPDASSIALNRVTGDAKSVIDGKLTGNGQIFVVNPNGVLFGQHASVDVGSLVASTAKVSDATMTGFGSSKGDVALSVDDANTGASVINAGQIKAEGGLVALHAAVVENNGMITNEGGRIALAAAKTISLSADTAGKINFDVDGTLAKASTLNTGVLKSDGGYVVMTAKQAGDVMSTVVNNTGTIEARTLRQDEKGEILLDGGNAGIVSVNGTLDASGVEAGQSAGSIKAIGAETHVKDGAALLARGQADGGRIETSGDYLEIGNKVQIDAAGETGKSGEWLLDPLNVVISKEKPADATKAADGDANGQYHEAQAAAANKVSWIDSETVNTLLSKGTNVTVQAVDKNKAATITVDSAITKRDAAEKDTTFSLQAQSNITVNQSITSTAGKLNVVLNSDIDGNGIGAVILNADINTNGGNFTAGSGGNVELTDGAVTGTADPTQGTVGTYFGNGSVKGNRTLTTNGGAITLYGDVALGLNGGSLVINPGAGAVTVTGNVDSGNGYKLHTMDDEDWDTLVSEIKGQYTADEWDTQLKNYYNSLLAANKSLKSGQYSAISNFAFLSDAAKEAISESYELSSGKSRADYSASEWRALLIKYYNKELSNEAKILQSGERNLNSSPVAYDKLKDTAKEMLSRYYVANNWDFAKALAQGDTAGGAGEGDTYLATITTSLENSLVSQGKENPLFVGGKGSGNPTTANPTAADKDHTDGYYWVTGPEGLANDGKGTKFASNDGTPEDNSYEKWNGSASSITQHTEQEPNNSGPYVSVGFGLASYWDDVSQKAGTTRGFVQETNLVHSGLVINSEGGKVDLQGNVGYSGTLSNLDITHADSVNIGGGKNQSRATLTGIVNTDHDVRITGMDVKVGDRIASGGNVAITSSGNITVNGIQATDKIQLASTGKDAVITLDAKQNDGALLSKSTAKDAVVIDAQGKNGSFVNNTSKDLAKAVTTGEGGSWKIYTSAPDRDTFGSNLNSSMNAQWGADSTTYAADTDTQSAGKYIFRVQPTISISADSLKKTYGDALTSADFTKTLSATATYTTDDGTMYDVTQDAAAYQEGNPLSHLANRETITAASNGMARTATRTNGDAAAADGNRAIYDVAFDTAALVARDGYLFDTDGLKNVTLEITRRQAALAGKGEQTYGNPTLTKWENTQQQEDDAAHTGFVNGDTIRWNVTNPVIAPDSSYAASQKGRATADAGTYENALAIDEAAITGAPENKDVSANYDLTFTDTLTVNKARLNIHTDDIHTTYGTVKEATTTIAGLTNGDDLPTGFTFDYGDYGGAYLNNNTTTNTPGRYAFQTSYDKDAAFLKNYIVADNDATVTITTLQPKPDIDHHTATNLTGSASYANNLSNHGIPGVDRVAGLASAELPFFKLMGSKVTNYGTYDVTADAQKVVLEPSGKRLPQPDQPKTQYREYTKNLVTSLGTGRFRLVYDGSIFHLSPLDAAANNLLLAGDATKNVELSAQALHTGFNEMGLMLEDLDAVYVHFDKA
ncbi:two-partner secretion domain-containing protein [Mitsuokella jalaludinii]|uniref:two-partner secretion domain-containing protein n=1 Tax=Mitsuokella jalaludinii TaxID=187979 RepID=UPI003F9CCF93